MKAEVSIQRLAEARGIVLKPHGKNLIGLCPWHNDHSPSLILTPEKNLWHCLGACGTGGSVIDWVMKAEGVSFRHAVEILRKGANLACPPKPLKGNHGRGSLPPPVSFDAKDHELMRQVVDYYHQTLKECPEALAYLEKRGIGNSEMIDHFKIGYANRTLGLRLPTGGRQAGAAIRERLTRLGIYRASGHEHRNGAIVFPIFDEDGHVSEIYGRKICSNLTPGLMHHLYLPGPHEGVFNSSALSASPDVILCEAIIDALSFWCAGFRNVTASYGVNGFTPDHLETFKKAGIKRVFIAYDRDEAGETAADELSKRLIGEGLECFRVQFPKGMDANAYALKVQPPEPASAPNETEGEQDGRARRMAAPPSSPEPSSVRHSAAESPAPELAPAPIPTTTPSSEAIFPLVVEAGGRPEASARTSPAPTAPEAEIRPEEIIIRLDDRRWRIRGMGKNMS